VLTQPMKFIELAKFLDIRFDYLQSFMDRLVTKGIFERKASFYWFTHTLVQKCLEDYLDDEYKLECHKNAAIFYL
jgi:hypothetical protein